MSATQPNLRLLLSRMEGHAERPAVFWRGQTQTYAELLRSVDDWEARLRAGGVGEGTVCGILGDYTPASIAVTFALMRLGAIAVPFTASVRTELTALMEIAGVQAMVTLRPDDGADLALVPGLAQNSLVERFRSARTAGLIVFSSGSTGSPKGILHDCERISEKFAAPRPGWRTVLFLMMDHFGGFNTLMSVAAYGGLAVCPDLRTPEAVCRAIEDARADLLPTTPTFLNMMIMSRVWERFDLSSVRLITYGAEPMPEATLRRVAGMFPQARLKQTYGLSELGVLQSQSPDPGSLWLKVGGSGFETRIVDGVLHVRSRANMVGYLNAPNPIDDEGWMSTGDLVEEKDGLVRFLGRVTEVVNVGGQKVFPAEVESVVMEADNVVDATAFGSPHPLLGQVVCARVSLARPEDMDALRARLRSHCLQRLAKFKVPARFEIVDAGSQASSRSKKIRAGAYAVGRAGSEGAGGKGKDGDQ